LSPITPAAERRRRKLTRAAPVVAIALVAFTAGVVTGAGGDSSAAQRFVDAWERGDTEAMYAELTGDAQEKYTLQDFERAYADAHETATIKRVTAGEAQDAESRGDDVRVVAMQLDTHAFGDLGGDLALPADEEGVAWEPHMVFPELEPGETLTRRTRAPDRAPILASDGTPLAEGPAVARLQPVSGASAVVGEVGAPPAEEERAMATEGFPPGSLTGNSGLELAFNDRLAGIPGGQLLAVRAGEEGSLRAGRVLASSEPQPGEPVRTTIDPALQEAAVTALGNLYGGVAVIDARKGSVLALAGIAFSAPQPPGSTFKVITTVAALDAGLVKLSDTFPVETSNSDIGREIANSHDAPCGGTFAQSFANSCNTVFAPLGVEVGGELLVETAEKFGFNSPPRLYDKATTAVVEPPPSTIPPDISDSVEVGESAIGQGRVLATPLQLATVSQVIASGGMRKPTPIAKDPELQPKGRAVRVTSKETASTVRDLMIGVVESGTGVAADLPNVQVAGKTGTAELGPKALQPGQDSRDPASGDEPEQELDAWFTAFAPARDPRLAIGVMVVNAEGDGGEIAAPIASQVLSAGLG
jgi:Penicillin binding protein transpeptidase domain/NTF2-like N-terminal transpeptidase domain/Penicillin-binding Protein dimerisation domain